MFGELIGETAGTATSIKVTTTPHGAPRVETTLEAHGTLLGVEIVDFGTYWNMPRPDGRFTGGADGLVLSQSAGGAVYSGTGVGWLYGQGGRSSWRGALYYTGLGDHFAGLNGMAVVYEFEIADNSKDMTAKYWEWK